MSIAFPRAGIPTLAIAALLLVAAAPGRAELPPYAEADFASVVKIDAHMHLYGEMPVFAARARTDGFRVLTINVNYRDFPPIANQQHDARALARAWPDRIAFAATIDAAGSGEPGWLEGVERRLDAALADGAVAVKFWKDIGMQHRDAAGRAVMIDDPRFGPLFDWLERRGVPVLGHQGEPRNAWLPLADMTIRGDREYFAEHPQYHMAGKAEWPGYEEQVAARDRMLDRHADLTFVGVHLASLEWDVDRIAAFLRRYPQASVDLAARLPHLQWQASRDHDKVRRFFIEFQDRILYGSDLSRGDGQTDAEFAAEAHEDWLADWQFLAGSGQLHSLEFDAPFHGLALPREVIDRIYRENARRILPTAWQPAAVQGDGIRLEFDTGMKSRVVATSNGEIVLGPYTESEALLTQAGETGGFTLQSRRIEPVTDALGEGRRTTLVGRSGPLVKEVEVTAYAGRPGWLFLRARYRNEGTGPAQVRGFTNHRYTLERGPGQGGPEFWSYQSASYESRPDWVLPIEPGYTRGNDLGMNESDYGGGTPVIDVWRRDVGLAIGHVELLPKLVALPIERAKRGDVTLALRMKREQTLAPGESMETIRSFVAVHRSDHFGTLRAYADIMQAQGIRLPNAPEDAFDPIWCAWGYGRGFTPAQVFETLPVVKQLGFGWAVLDDGWQVALGDWRPREDKFPASDADMKALVDRIHAAGLKAQLWWAPMAADAGSHTAREHPDWLLRNADGSTRAISWWDSQYLCPAVDGVREDAAAFARKALAEWGFDGLKIDGQHLNAAPECFNPAHAHASPAAAPEGVPGFFQAIWESAQAVKPGAVIEICPCGTGYSFFTLPYLNMTVASDPESSWQIRSKGKTLKALAGDRIAYFGDHVEMSEGGEDFASTFGVGGVIGTNFAWPGAPGDKDRELLLTPQREKAWARWVALYEALRLSEGEYLGGLYDIGFDRPEAHVVRKGESLYYAFFAPDHAGEVELRGLVPGRTYAVRDYVSDVKLGTVEGPVATLPARFSHSLLLEAKPRS
jgi:alpha-galactosidase